MPHKKFIKNIGWMGLTQIIVALNGIILLPFITKLLGAENYGIWTQILITLGILNPFALLGLQYSLVRFLPAKQDKEEIKDGIWSVSAIVGILSIIVAIFLLIFSAPISRYFHCAQIFIQLLAFIAIFEFINTVFSYVFISLQQIKEYCLFAIFQTVAATILVISAMFMGYGLLGAVACLLASKIFNFIGMGSLIIKKIGFGIPKFLKIKEHLHFGLPTILTDISFWIIQSSDKYFLGFILGTIFVGYYAPAYTLGCCLSFFIMPINFILPATLSKYYEENRIDKVKIYLEYSLKYFLLIAIPAVFGLSVLAKPLLTVFSTPEIATHSYFVIPFVALSFLLFGVYIISYQNLALKKKTRTAGFIWLAGAIFNLLLNFILIPTYGILGAAIATLISYTFLTSLIYYYSSKELSFNPNFYFIFKSSIASVLMSLFIISLQPRGFQKTIFAIFSGLLVYTALVFAFRCFDKQELGVLKSFFRKTT